MLRMFTMQEHRFQFAAMTTPCSISLVDACPRQANIIAQQIMLRTRALERKYNFHNPDSWLNRVINQRRSNRVAVDAEAASVLEKVWMLSTSTVDRFDISIATLNHAAKEHPGVCRETLREELSAAMGTHCWRVNGYWLEFDDARTRLDLGGVIKEFAVDKAAELAAGAGGGSLISFGGDVRVQGRKANGDLYRVGVKNPDAPEQLLMSLALENVAITTSGNYERQEHIISDTPATSALSATVIAEDALTAGVYSTSLMLDVETTLPDEMKCVVVDKHRQVYSNLAA